MYYKLFSLKDLIKSNKSEDIIILAQLITKEYYLDANYYNDAVDYAFSLLVRLKKNNNINLFLENTSPDFLDWLFIDLLPKMKLVHIYKYIKEDIPEEILNKYSLN